MRALLFETRTGRPVMDLQVSSWQFDTGVLAPDELTVHVPSYTRWAQTLDLAELLTPYKYSLALVDETVAGVRRVPAAGPIVARPPDDDPDGTEKFKVTARGIETLLARRYVRKFPGWPLLNAAGKPTGTYDMAFENLSYGTIMKKLVQESELFVGGDLPIVYEPDRAGIHERNTYEAVDGHQVLELVDNIADLADGVEYDFQPQIDEYDNVSYRLVTGVDGDGTIVNSDHLVWNLGGARPDIRGFEPNDQIADVVTDAVFHAGKGDDKVLLARASDSTLVDDGWPRLELWDSSHSSVTVLSTLQSWADGAVTGVFQHPAFEVRADKAVGVRHGDIVEIVSQGHWYWPDGVESRRVLSVDCSSSDPDWVSVQLV